MGIFNSLGYDKTVTFYQYVAPVSASVDATYAPAVLHNCHVVIGNQAKAGTNGKESENKVTIAFMMADNPNVTITDKMTLNSFMVIGDTSTVELCEDFMSYMNKYYECYTLNTIKKEDKVLPHYELGGK